MADKNDKPKDIRDLRGKIHFAEGYDYKTIRSNYDLLRMKLVKNPYAQMLKQIFYSKRAGKRKTSPLDVKGVNTPKVSLDTILEAIKDRGERISNEYGKTMRTD